MIAQIIPKGVSHVMLLCCGRLKDYGHQVFYNGIKIRFSTLA